MAYVNDFSAGLADLLALPSDVISLGMGVVKYPFKKIFTDSENPFAEGVANSWAGQFSQGIRDFNTDLFNSDPESKARRAGSDVGGFALDLFTGGSGKFARAGVKAALKGNMKRALPLAGRALGDTAVTNTAINMGLSALTGEGLTPTESVIAGAGFIGAQSMIRRGTKYFASKAKALEEQFKPTPAQQYASDMHYYDKVDARSGAVRAARREGFDIADENLITPKDNAKIDPLLSEVDDRMAAFSMEDAELNKYNQLYSELQQRLQAPISIANKFEDDAALPGIMNALGVKTKEAAREALNSMSFDSLIDLMKKHPEIFPETGYVDQFGVPLSNAKLLMRFGEQERKLSADQLRKNKEFFDLFQKDLKANLEAGMITDREFAKESQRARQVGYIPKGDMDVSNPNTNGLLGVTPNSTSMKAATKAGKGVMRQANSFKVAYNTFHSHSMARLFNARIHRLGQSLESKIPQILADAAYQKTLWAKKAASSTGWEKKLAEDNVKYYQGKMDDLSKFEFNYKPKRNANDEIIFPPDRDIVSYMSKGEQKFFTIPKNYMRSLFSYGDANSNKTIKGIQQAHNFALPFRTGKWNVLNFGFTKMAYGLWEAMPALVSEAKLRGKDLSAWTVMLEQAKQAKNILSNEYYKWMINNIERRGTFLGHSAQDIGTLKQKITEPLFSIWTSPYDNFAELNKIGSSQLFDVINADNATGFEMLKYGAQIAWNWIDRSAPAEILRMLNQAAADSASATTTQIAKNLFSDSAERQDFLRAVAKKSSDTRRRGAGVTKTGAAIKTLSDVMPYGKSTVQGMAGKLDYFDIGKNIDILNNLVHGSTGMDKLTNLATVLAGKTQGEVFDMLWKFVVVPTAICYFWNNMTPDQAEDYHELNTLARSKNRLLMNFGGRGVHAYFPVDQEWSVLSNITESILDDIFNLSDQDPNNPDWKYQNQVLKAAGRALGIELPVPVNLLTGAVGFEANVNAETLLGGEDSVIEPTRGSGLEGYISYALGETLGTVGNMISIGLSDRPFDADMIGQMPLITDAWTQQHNNSTSEYVDAAYKRDPQNFPYKNLMAKRKYMEARLRQYKATGKTMDGREYNMPRQQVIETITHNIHKINGEMYRKLKEGE